MKKTIAVLLSFLMLFTSLSTSIPTFAEQPLLNDADINMEANSSDNSADDASSDFYVSSDIEESAPEDTTSNSNTDNEQNNDFQFETPESAEEIPTSSQADGEEETPDTPVDPRLMLHFGYEGEIFPTGNYSRTDTDFTVSTAAFDFAFTRTYNSQDGSIIRNYGTKWQSVFDIRLYGTQTAYEKSISLPNGKYYTFKRKSSSPLVYTCDDTFDTLTFKNNKFYYHIDSEPYEYEFTSGYLSAIVHENGQKITFQRASGSNKITSFTDPSGNTYTITYGGSNQNYITRIESEQADVNIEYTYSGSRLTQVNANGILYHYTYTTVKNSVYMTEVKDGNGHTIESMEYITSYINSESTETVAEIFPFGSLKTHIDKYGLRRSYSYSYNSESEEFTVKTQVYDYDEYTITMDENGDVINVRNAEYDDATTYTYDSRHQIIQKNDPLKGVTNYTRDENGRITQIQYADDATCSYQYNDKDKITSILTSDGSAEFYVYDENQVSLLYSAKYLGTADDSTTFDPLTATQLNFNIKAYTYYTAENDGCRKGLLNTYTDPCGNTTTYTRDEKGNITSSTLAGKTTAYTYDVRNRLSSKTSPMGKRTEYIYDANGNLLKTTFVPTGAVTRNVYDAAGKLKQTIGPDQYNSAFDGLNAEEPQDTYSDNTVGTRYVHSSHTSYTKIDPDGSRFDYSKFYLSGYYNTLESTRYFSSDGTSALVSVIHGYDSKGLNTVVYYAKNGIMEHAYDYSYFPVSQAFGPEQATYKKVQQRKEVVFGADLIDETEYYYNCRDQLVAVIYDDSSQETYEYRLDGKVLKHTVDNGTTTRYTYSGNTCRQNLYYGDYFGEFIKVQQDPCGRMTAYCYGDSAEETYTYDAFGNVTESVIGLARTVYTYDNDGECIKKEEYTSDTDKLITEYQIIYDSSTHTKTVTEKKHISANTIYNSSDTFITTVTVYDVAGNPVKTVDGNGVVTLHTFDPCGRELSASIQNSDGSQTLLYSQTYSPYGKIATYSDGLGNTTTYSYDELGNLTGITDPNGYTYAYQYDFHGRLLRERTSSNDLPDTDILHENHIEYQYDCRDRVSKILYNTRNADGTMSSAVYRRYLYDGDGNKTYEYDNQNTKLAEYTYSINHRLLSVKNDPIGIGESIATQEYQYDYHDWVIRETVYPLGTKHYTYDWNGNILSTRIGDKTIATYTYDKLGNRLSAQDAQTNAVYTYNELGLVKTITHAGDTTIPANTVTRKYDKNGNLVYESDSLDTVQLYTYDNQNRVIALTISRGNENYSYAWSYDNAGRLLSEIDGCGYVTTYTYDGCGNILTKTKAGKTVTKTYNPDGKLLKSTDWNGVDSMYTYDWLGNIASRFNVDGVYEETYTYDINGNVISSYDGFGTTTYTYNPSYNFELILIKDGENRVKYRLSRDPYKTGLVEVVEDYTPYAYSINEMGNIASVGYYYHGTSPTYSLTNARHLTIPGSTDFAAEHMTYDNYGNILTRTDAKGNTTSYEYNCQGLLTKTTYPCAQGQTAPKETRFYFADKTLNYSIDRNSYLTEYQYDALGRCTSEVVSSVDLILGTKSRTYDANGNLLNDGHIQRTYDAFNRVLTHTQNGFETVTYTYDVPYTSQGLDISDGYETVIQSTKFSVHHMYDSNGLLRAVSNKDGTVARYQYDNGHCTSYHGVTGYTTCYQYNQAGQITQIRDYTATSWYGVLEYLLCYTYDERANMTSEIAKEDGVTVNTKNYTYDSANRLICETDSSQSVKIEYMYDKNGNLENKYTKDLQNDDVYRSLQLYAYDVNNRVTSSFSDTISYDANGNSLQANNHNLNVNYTYDGFNRIKTAAPVGQNQTFEYTYASDNLRLQTVCRDALGNEVYRYGFLYDTSGNLLVRKKTNADGSVCSNCVSWGISPRGGYSPIGMTIPESGNNQLCAGFMQNAHGDVVRVRVMTSISSSYVYDAYGDILEENIEFDWFSNPFRYAGYYYDTETGLYYLKNRYYNGYSTRFLTEDPYWNVSNMLYGKFTSAVERRVYYPAVVQNGNRYVYCSANPIRFTDSHGYWQEGDENLSPEAQVYILYYTEQYYYYDEICQKSDDVKVIQYAAEDREKMHRKADEIRALDAEGKVSGIYHDVPIYSQGKYNLCWAYCQVMAEDYHNGITRTQKEAEKRAKEIAVEENGWFSFEKGFDAWNDGGTPQNRGKPVYSNKASDLLEPLQDSPLYVSYRDGIGENSSGHGILITGLVSVMGHPTLVTTNNPWGKKNIQTYHDLLKKIPGDDENQHKKKLYRIYRFVWEDDE